ncbi:MAG: hypothetical protein LLF28_04340 [Nitrospiraceae bacterium]|nr:hypothetical protein [Nitrospiraceae bacterium]
MKKTVLFICLAFLTIFPLFVSNSYALTITGSEGITTNSINQYTTDCNGTVWWSVTGIGATINLNGILTTTSSSCGGITVTAGCSDEAIAAKEVRVTNAGIWLKRSDCWDSTCTWPNWSAENTIIGKYLYQAGFNMLCVRDNITCDVFGPCKNPCQTPLLPQPGLTCTQGVLTTCTCSLARVYEWVCQSVCTDGQTQSCYSGASETKGVGLCQAGTQTCSGGQWGTCVGEVLPTEEICGDNLDNNCNGQVDEGCGCGITLPIMPEQIRQCDSKFNTTEIKYDNTKKTICRQGCAMSSLTMLMNSAGCYVDLHTVNSCQECFKSGEVDWGKVLIKYCPQVKYNKRKDFSYDFPEPLQSVLNITQLRDDFENGYKYILQIQGSDGRCSHFVLLKGISDDCSELQVIDPANRVTTVSEICGYRRFK